MAVWVLTEWAKDHLKDISLGLLGEGKRLADISSEALHALVLGDKPKEEMQELFAYGANEVILVDIPSIWRYHLNTTADILSRLIRESQPRLVLFAASHLGNEMGGRLTVSCHAGLVTNAARLEVEKGQTVIVKNTYRDKIESRICINTDVQLVTLKGKELQPIKPDFKCEGTVVRSEIAWDIHEEDFEVIDYIKGDPKDIDLGEAEVIVAGGKGVEGEQRGFELIQSLADLLGASVGGSREAVDRGWLPFDRQIGQTGKTVSPRCIVTLGISGAIQFVKGIEDSKNVIAVNTDKKAPIFDFADLKIVGDLHEIVDALIEYIEQVRLAGLGT